jgi:hypothetical protein
LIVTYAEVMASGNPSRIGISLILFELRVPDFVMKTE